MRQVLRIATLFFLILSLGGCVTIFGTKKQNVRIISATPDSDIYIENRNTANDSIKNKFLKNNPHTLMASRNGFKTRYGVLSPEKTSFLIYGDLAASAVIIGLVGLVLDISLSPVKIRRFKSNYEFPELKALPRKSTQEKFVWVQDVIVNINEDDVIGEYYSSLRKMKRDKPTREYLANENILYDVPLFQRDMNDILMSYGYSDTNENVIPSSWNSVYLTSEIKMLNTKIAGLKSTQAYYSQEGVFSIDVNVEWVLYDGFGNELMVSNTNGASDVRLASSSFSDSEFQKSMKDAIEYAIIDLYDNSEFKDLLQLDTELAAGSDNPLTEIDVDFMNESDREISLTDQIESIVRVFSGGSSFSGTVISDDGYIVTSYQAISNGKEVNVDIGGSRLQADIVSSNIQLNLALLKVDSINLTPVNLNEIVTPSIGDRVYTLSYSSIEILDKYVSSGIVSGFRSFQANPYIQSDVPMSSGNTGGTMLNKKGQLVGILNAKASSEGVEGIGFTIPINEVLKGLNIVISR